MSAKQRKLKNYLIDKDLQLRYVAFVTAMSALICGTLGYLIWQQAKVATATIKEQLGGNPELVAEVVKSVESQDQGLLITMLVAFVLLVVVLSLILVIMTHKVAGPLYKVTLYLDKMSEGRLDQVWPLRKGDMLQNFYGKFERAHAALRERHTETADALERYVQAAEAAGVGSGGEGSHTLDEMRAHVAQRKEAVS